MKKQAFTLIELMVVVAIIAILATLSVTSFSAAIKRTRNAGRQSDIQAVGKALETCYDVASGKYTSLPTGQSGSWVELAAEPTTGPFKSGAAAGSNSCLNQDIAPGIASYPYGYKVMSDFPQAFAVCAKLEEVANWESVGNVAGDDTSPTGVTCGADGCAIGTPCAADSTSCWFCAINQQ